MVTITIEPATPARTDDAEHALTGGGDGASCQCQFWRLRNSEWQATRRVDREQMLRDEIDTGPPPALIAYVDGEAAGWVRVGPRTAQQRLARTKAFVANSPEPWEDTSVWAVTCFVVRREYRGHGLMAQLLAAAIAHARAAGARIIEAYPTDTGVSKTPANELYIGVLSVFQAAGFHEVARPRPERTIVQLDLTRDAA